MQKKIQTTLLWLLLAAPLHAFETVQVSEQVYALVGELGQRSPENLGHNMTSGFIITSQGVIVIDAGACLAGADAIIHAIEAVTDQPIRWVINSGGQDHRWIGNTRFIELGATLIASEAARDDMVARSADQFGQARRFIQDRFEETNPTYPNLTFQQRYRMPIEELEIELIYTGGGHTPGDIFIWLPQQSILFTGDIVYTQRILGVQPGSGARWLKSLEYMRDMLKPRTIIPGHGAVTDLNRALKDSYDYLQHLHHGIEQAINEGAFDPVEAAEQVDQSPFSYLHNYSSRLRGRNALRIAEELFKQEASR